MGNRYEYMLKGHIKDQNYAHDLMDEEEDIILSLT